MSGLILYDVSPAPGSSQGALTAEDPRARPLYCLAEAARYLGLPTSTLRGWVSGFGYRVRGGARRAEALIHAPRSRDREVTLSFYNLVEAHLLASLRRAHAVPMQKVRKAVALARRRQKDGYPLLRARLSADGEDVVIERDEGAETASGQCVFPFAVERPSARVEWEPSGALPVRLYPPISGEEPAAWRRIVIDPARALGKPLLASAGVPTALIAARHREGASIPTLADAFGLDRSSIEEALRYELRLAA